MYVVIIDPYQIQLIELAVALRIFHRWRVRSIWVLLHWCLRDWSTGSHGGSCRGTRSWQVPRRRQGRWCWPSSFCWYRCVSTQKGRKPRRCANISQEIVQFKFINSQSCGPSSEMNYKGQRSYCYMNREYMRWSVSMPQWWGDNELGGHELE